MVDIPEDTVTLQDLKDWYQAKDELGRLKSKEALMRTRIFKFYFKDPVEGVNTAEIDDGTGAVIKGQYVLNRTVDPGALDALRTAMQTEGANVPKINLDKLVKWKPEVAVSEYRALTDEERNFFDQALIVKPGSPQMEIVIPKRPKAGD